MRPKLSIGKRDKIEAANSEGGGYWVDRLEGGLLFRWAGYLRASSSGKLGQLSSLDHRGKAAFAHNVIVPGEKSMKYPPTIN